MTKKQEQLMRICPNSKECSPEKRKACGSRHCEIHEEGGACHYEDKIVGCPACIPVQPATCPDCGHPTKKHKLGYCYGSLNCPCKRTPVDLQPELRWRCPKCHHIANVHEENGCFSQEGCDCKMTKEEILEYREPIHPDSVKVAEQPTQMPLREQMPLIENLWRDSNSVVETIRKYHWITEGRGCYEYDDARYRKETANAFSQILATINSLQDSLRKIQAHDSEVASKVRRELLKNLHKHLSDYLTTSNKDYNDGVNACLFDINRWEELRAMAEVK